MLRVFRTYVSILPFFAALPATARERDRTEVTLPARAGRGLKPHSSNFTGCLPTAATKSSPAVAMSKNEKSVPNANTRFRLS
jgi:hypothetical protein